MAPEVPSMAVTSLDDTGESWRSAEAAIGRGEVVGLPTDTVYGLVAAFDSIDKLFEIKGRDRSNPVAVLVADIAQATTLVELDPSDRRLVDRYWPGALTIVAPRRAGVSIDVGGDGSHIGVRCPGGKRLRALLDRTGPLAATSANTAGASPLETAGEICGLAGVALVIEGGRLAGPASTVVRAGIVLRAGATVPDGGDVGGTVR